jgi:hypothetical protein
MQLRRYYGAAKALLRRYYGAITALFKLEHLKLLGTIILRCLTRCQGDIKAIQRRN